MECQKCKKTISKRGAHFLCQGTCQGTFHRGCVRGLLSDLKNGKDRLYCNNCEDEGSEDEEREEGLQEYAVILRDIQRKVGDIPGFKKQLDVITQSLSLLSDKYDTLILEHEQSKKQIIKLEKSVSNINNKCTFLEKQNTALEQRLSEHEQASRKQNLEIVGIEELPKENVKEIVTKISEVLNVSHTDVEWARRAHPPRTGRKPAPIIVGFKTSGATSRDAWLSQRNKLATMSSTITNGPATNRAYINEDLTMSMKTLLYNTKKRLHGLYKYVWVSNGKILVKKSDGDKSVCMRADSDLNTLIEKHEGIKKN